MLRLTLHFGAPRTENQLGRKIKRHLESITVMTALLLQLCYLVLVTVKEVADQLIFIFYFTYSIDIPCFWTSDTLTLYLVLPGVGKLAELAEQLGKIVEHSKSKSTQPRFTRCVAP